MTKAEVMKREQTENSLKEIEKILPMRCMMAAKVDVCRAKIKAINEMNLAGEQRKAAIADGQEAGELLIRIEARIGEIAKSIPQERGRENQYTKKCEPKPKDKASKSKQEKLGITLSQMNNARTIANNPDAIEEAIARAKEDDEIPTRSAVLKIVASHRRAEKRDKEEPGKPDINKIAYRMAREMDGWFNSFNKIIDDWDSVSPENKEDLGRQFNKLNMIFIKMKKNAKSETKPLMITKE